MPIGKRIGVRIHLLICTFCLRYEQQLHLIRDTLRRLAADGEKLKGMPASTLSEEARERIKKSLQNP